MKKAGIFLALSLTLCGCERADYYTNKIEQTYNEIEWKVSDAYYRNLERFNHFVDNALDRPMQAVNQFTSSNNFQGLDNLLNDSRYTSAFSGSSQGFGSQNRYRQFMDAAIKFMPPEQAQAYNMITGNSSSTMPNGQPRNPNSYDPFASRGGVSADYANQIIRATRNLGRSLPHSK